MPPTGFGTKSRPRRITRQITILNTSGSPLRGASALAPKALGMAERVPQRRPEADAQQHELHQHVHEHDDHVTSFCLLSEEPLDPGRFFPWIRSVAPGGFISTRQERDKAVAIAARFAIDVKRMGSAVGTLSGGNQQKVAVGKWLGADPKVMLLEEPTRGVDIGARAEIYQRLRDLCAAGLGIIVSSSDTAEVLGLSDTIATFYRGRLTTMRPQAEWTEDALVREVMHQEAAA